MTAFNDCNKATVQEFRWKSNLLKFQIQRHQECVDENNLYLDDEETAEAYDYTSYVTEVMELWELARQVLNPSD